MDAPAKVNLALHVVGQRADGHHLLESLVTFADKGDRIGLAHAEADGFSVSGRFGASVPADEAGQADNLVVRARDRLRAALIEAGQEAPPVALHLEKSLPVASGIGGGSADAAATLKGLLRLWQATLPADVLGRLALSLGADVPMCLISRPLIARGIGEAITLLEDVPVLPMLLVNPLKPVSTPEIFRRLTEKANPPLVLPAGLQGLEAWFAALQPLRNDLEPPARALERSIAAVDVALRANGPRLARMSGSGATCFALFGDLGARDRAAERVVNAHPDWFVLSCLTASSRENADAAA
ncbi:4-(cytidine 5'-diphospho)-2-C-methyl-D-erythritol kinase [Xaviernesmea oryzae]|uniref:4-diphosphocytidyl-2-C-methyl-D-erythritol kinase n=2 Tax=Xaviernesmea oryzae TaxID=464029 RepID=A0A1Q9ATS0_9HYPH|nr:4-(cytidine 5'-diphospho)-2-C-methyl-D-erythritol kinase [Xaviernesmea oryzae]OLP58813.1 4-(cytidine 5'-diphospho)-2-C-methyl-D-erythritol kinase [Xaviernesmea oryzae]